MLVVGTTQPRPYPWRNLSLLLEGVDRQVTITLNIEGQEMAVILVEAEGVTRYALCCKKGSRECTYPEPRATPKPPSGPKRDQAPTAAEDSSSSSDSHDSSEESTPIGRRRKKGELQKPGASSLKTSQPKQALSKFQTASLVEQPRQSVEQVKHESSLSPSTEASSDPASVGWSEKPEKSSSVSTDVSQEDRVWSHLSPDLRFYLEYHTTHLNYHHYFFKHDANHFLHNILVEHALLYEPLLYAVVGFAAFQLTVTRPGGKIQDFLGYYNRAVSLLRKSLVGNQKHTDATMLTILQLATFEDYLGDLVSLLGHQKAAHGMLLELYSSHSIMETEVRRKILAWYSRFDVMGGLMSGYQTVLGREWFVATEDYYRQQSLSYPNSIDYKIEAVIAKHRLLAVDMALLFAQLPRGAITIENFERESDKFAEQIRTWKENLDPIFQDPSYLVDSFEGKERAPEDIVDPYLPGGLYKGAMFTFNFMLIDWHAIKLIHGYKTASMLKRPLPLELSNVALDICRLFEAIEYWSDSPPGSMLKAQGSLGLALLVLPKDEKHIMWCRRKLAKVESSGHIYPSTFRRQLADLWGIPEVNEWWLPDKGTCPPVVRSVRSFMEIRLPQAESESRSEDQRNIKGFFSQLSLHESPRASLKQVGRQTTTPLTKSTILSADDLASQSLAGHTEAADVDQDMGSDDSMLAQSRESFYDLGV
ncbi:hypothetical protein IMSHALPRED_009020 [Imshaugia aleurites]|uniref:Uncharacterized protein n=1 Tax=Imshaugia aleurites TaxID=172621 RepID=A0A8H3FXR7_9LECA|nr:hypothetical protein IMSHALPRED_009020 [Imshaugia aleurites]